MACIYINMNPPWVYTCSQSWTPSHLPSHTISLGHPSAPVPSILYPASNLDWRFISYMILHMFQCHSPKSSHPLLLPQSPKDCSIHLCLFCCLALLGIHTEETRIERETCTPMLIAALFIIARTWKQPRCPSADGWIRKLWYIYTGEYYSASNSLLKNICMMHLEQYILIVLSQRNFSYLIKCVNVMNMPN